MSAVLFDLNGTLVDDVPRATRCTSAVLTGVGLPSVSREEFRDAFRLPLTDFFASLGVPDGGLEQAVTDWSAAMRRAVDRTGVLTGDSLMMGVDLIKGDFSWDAFVPLTFSILTTPHDFTGYDLQTVAKWNTVTLDYDFPEFPKYWKVMTETAWSEEGTYLGRDGEVLQTAVIAPGFPGPLAHLDIALPVALEQHLVRDLGTDQRVAGLTCHLWRSRDPLDGSAFAPAQGPDHTDSCVSSAGEVLSDAWYLGGSLVQRRVATQVTDGPSLEGAQLFDGRTPVPLAPNEVTASVTRSDAATLTRLLQLPQPSAPSGMRD